MQSAATDSSMIVLGNSIHREWDLFFSVHTDRAHNIVTFSNNSLIIKGIFFKSRDILYRIVM